ncbi:MAG: hypothetical protein Kow0029_19130 [Candidatus Rifleibacteriota bacterium]
MAMEEKKYRIGELAELTQLSRRTIRFYIQNGLVDPPLGKGRGHYYTGKHLAQLQQIIRLKDNRHSLEEIASIMKNEPESIKKLPTPTIWTRIPIIPGIEIHIQGGSLPLTPSRIDRLQKFAYRLFGIQTKPSKGEDLK